MASGYTRLPDEGRGGGHRSYGATDPTVGFAPSTTNTSTEFFQLCEKITNHLFTINNATFTLEKLLKQVGTPSDSQQLRDRITQIHSSAGAAVQETTPMLRSLQPYTTGNKQRRIQADRLQSEFQAAASRFSETQKKVVSTVRSARLPADMVAVEQDAAASTDQLVASEEQRQEKMKELQDIEFETAMHIEKEERVRQLETDIIDINVIMRDLSSMVTAQGDIVDSIEENVETAHGHVEEGREELIKAARYQSKSRRRLCILILILVVVVAIIGIILALHYTKQ